ncbi:MAG TPA: FtsX-like permease family protein [Bryobacteraceae bacterium]|nr:FtsX-like permease family protein [Bryobacteraceae bacterium]
MTDALPLPASSKASFGIRTASKIAWRELHAAPAKFIFVVLAVAVGVAALSGVKGFGYAFRGMLLRNAKQLIAADLQAQTWGIPTPEQIGQFQKVADHYGSMTRVTETISMAGSAAQRVPQMVSVKGVDPSVYPYYGKLKLDPAQPLSTLLANNSSAVVTPELLLRLKIKPGESLRLGGKEFRIVGTIVSEPDRLASGFGPGMRVIVSRAGLERTGLIQFGSRAAQRFLFKLKPDANLDAIKPRLEAIIHRVFISDYREGSPVVGKAIDNTTTFLSLISLIALIVGSLGVAMAMYSHLQQRMDTIAVMKALGARAGQVMQIYLIQTLWLGLAGGLIGVAIGALVQKSFPFLIHRVFALLPEVPWDWSFSIQGLSLGVLATLLFTVPPLLSIRNVRPSLVFRRNMSDAATESRRKWREKIPSWSGAVLIVLGFCGIAIWLSGSWRMGLYFMAGLTASILLLAGVAALLLFLMRWIVRRWNRRLPSSFRHGFANLYRPGNQARSVLVALGIGVMFTLSTYLLQRTVLQQVIREGPGREGNLFLLDIRNSSELTSLIESQPGVTSKVQLVGYIVSRMLSKNGVPASQLPLTKEHKADLQTVRITTAQALPTGVALKQGKWWRPKSTEPQLAVSEDAARSYKLRLGDQLQFQVAGQTIEAPLVAIFRREQRAPVRYELVFPEDALKGLPVVYYGAVHVDAGQIPQVEEAVFDRFPTVTVMNLAEVLKRIQEAVDQVALVIRFLALFAILAGVIILSSSVAGTRYRRIREVAILKALGATRRRIMNIFSVEFSILGAISGLIGAILANVFTRIIANKFIDAPFDFNWWSLLIAMIGTVLLANFAGWLASARILNQKPLEVLRNE